MISRMGVEKLSICYMVGVAAAVACCHDAPHTCTVAVHRSELEIEKLEALKVQGISCVDSLHHSTAAVLSQTHAVCLQGYLSSTDCNPLLKCANLFKPYRT
jgi:hypothetical protein